MIRVRKNEFFCIPFPDGYKGKNTFKNIYPCYISKFSYFDWASFDIKLFEIGWISFYYVLFYLKKVR